nr:MAG TPA: hypothetical protein [Caudoviricetes sp.]
MWQTWPDEESGMWRIVRWRNGQKEFALGTWPTLKLAQLMCDRLNEAEDRSSRYKKRPAERAFRQGRR